MNNWMITIPIAYLLGSIPVGYLLVKTFRKEDIRATGSGNIGATNVARSGAKGLGLATLLLDIAKTYVAVEIAKRLAPGDYDLAVGAAIAAMIGYVFPVWLGFRGGKGVAGGLGIFIALEPLASLCILGVFLAVFALTRYVSLGSILAAASLPLFAFYFDRHPSPLTIFGFLFIPAVICLRHQANIRRLIAGTESKFGSREAAV